MEILADRFELGELIAEGGMGTVYRARDRDTGAAVAVKRLASAEVTDVERFVREATTLARRFGPPDEHEPCRPPRLRRSLRSRVGFW